MSRIRVGIAADHGGFELKALIAETLRNQGREVEDFGAHRLDPADDYPDFVIPLAHAVASGRVGRGLALCGSGVGASIAANKVAGVRAGLIHDVFSARQGVEDDDMNVLCLGGNVIGTGLALTLIDVFLDAGFTGAPRHQRRLAKVQALDKRNLGLIDARKREHHMNMLSDRESDSSERSRLLARAISRWDNEGGAGDGGRVPQGGALDTHPPISPT